MLENKHKYDGAPSHFHNWVTRFSNRQLLSDISADGYPIPDQTDLQIWLSRISSVGLCKRRGLHSDKSYRPEQPEESTMNSDRKQEM